jgi:hypothetical protein
MAGSDSRMGIDLSRLIIWLILDRSDAKVMRLMLGPVILQ